jgi:hypothetical protein
MAGNKSDPARKVDVDQPRAGVDRYDEAARIERRARVLAAGLASSFNEADLVGEKMAVPVVACALSCANMLEASGAKVDQKAFDFLGELFASWLAAEVVRVRSRRRTAQVAMLAAAPAAGSA